MLWAMLRDSQSLLLSLEVFRPAWQDAVAQGGGLRIACASWEAGTAPLFPPSSPSAPAHGELWCTCSLFRGEGARERFLIFFCPCLWHAWLRPICSCLRFSPPLISPVLLDFTLSRRTEFLAGTPPQRSAFHAVCGAHPLPPSISPTSVSKSKSPQGLARKSPIYTCLQDKSLFLDIHLVYQNNNKNP